MTQWHKKVLENDQFKIKVTVETESDVTFEHLSSTGWNAIVALLLGMPVDMKEKPVDKASVEEEVKVETAQPTKADGKLDVDKMLTDATKKARGKK